MKPELRWIPFTALSYAAGLAGSIIPGSVGQVLFVVAVVAAIAGDRSTR